MAGTIPGVESARRRRFHGGSDSSFTINSGYRFTRSRGFYDTRLSATSFLQTCMINHSDQDEKLGGVARKAKERLDERLRSHRKSEINSSQERSRGTNYLVKEFERKPSSSMVVGNLQMEVFGLKRSGSKKFNWGKMGSVWKSLEQDECVVCLEKFKVGEKLDRLPCAHRFHSICVLPWLESHAHCPCCRMSVLGLN